MQGSSEDRCGHAGVLAPGLIVGGIAVPIAHVIPSAVGRAPLSFPIALMAVL